MATFRDDIARVGKRVLEAVEQRAGREVVPAGQTAVLESERSESRGLRKMLDFIGFTLWNYAGTQPSPYRMPTDLLPSARIFFAGQALRTWMEDPMAGQYVDLYCSFVLGRGVPTAQAHDDEVQDLLDETWADKANQRVITSHEKLVEKLVDLSLQSNVYFVFFDDGDDGQVRVSLKRFEDVLDVVRHPADTYRILYYKVSEREYVYDYSKDAYSVPVGDSGKPEIVYYEAYGAFDDTDPVMAMQDRIAAEQLRALQPPANRLRPGKIVHLAVNKNSEMAFGVPRMQKLQRWYTAYNEVLESHVNRMKAMASIYMKQTARGADKRVLDRLAEQATGRASSFGDSAAAAPTPRRHVPGPMADTGILQENDAVTHTPFKIDSGAADVSASLPQLRAQISGIFPPSYYGQNAGELAGAQTVELPVLKFIELDQECLRGVFRKLAESRIQAAIRTGFLSEWRDPTETELDMIASWQQDGTPLDGIEFDPSTGQVKRDLGFEISLPSPLKRAMTDLVAAAVQTATAVDPMAQNPELTRWLFGFILAEAFDVDDPQRIVDQVFPRRRGDDQASEEAPGPRDGQGTEDPTSTGPDGQQHTAANPYGAKVNSPPPERRPQQRVAESAAGDREQLVEDEFDAMWQAADEALDRIDLPALASANGHAG